MRFKSLAVLGASMLIIGAGCGATPVPTPAPQPASPSQPASPAPKATAASFGAPVDLNVGSSVTYEDGLEVTLEKINDSRCPKGVKCVWQGELAPVLRLQGGELGNAPQELQLGTVRAPKQTLGAYALELRDVTASSMTLQTSKSAVQAPADDKIQVSSPQANQVVTSPLVVTGQARGPWYFEASFPVRLLDANGKVLAATTARAQSDWMTTDFVPFKATLTFDAPSTPTGTLVLANDNPSGLPANADSRSVPIRFAAPVAKTGPSGVVCTMEAKLCPDGGYVSRTGPNCEFAPCPSIPNK